MISSKNVQKQSIYHSCPDCKTKIYCIPHVCTNSRERRSICNEFMDRMKEMSEEAREANSKTLPVYHSFKELEQAIDDQIHIYDSDFERMYGDFLRYNPPLKVFKIKGAKRSAKICHRCSKPEK